MHLICEHGLLALAPSAHLLSWHHSYLQFDWNSASGLRCQMARFQVSQCIWGIPTLGGISFVTAYWQEMISKLKKKFLNKIKQYKYLWQFEVMYLNKDFPCTYIKYLRDQALLSKNILCININLNFGVSKFHRILNQ